MRMRTCLVLSCAAAIVAAGWLGCARSVTPAPAPDEDLAKQIRGGATGGASADASTATAATGEGWGELSGTFVFVGAPPQLGSLATLGKDGAVCDVAPIPNQALVVDSATRGIADIAVYARKVARVNEEILAAYQDPTVFDQKQCVFLSHVKAVLVGQEVEIKNSDPIGHNTNISPPADQGANVLIKGGESAPYKFGRQQDVPVPVQCNIHPWMKAYILPRKDPYFAVTDTAGKFSIRGLPAGEEIEFQLWQESGTGSKGELIVPDLTDNKGRFRRTIPADGVLDLETIEIPASAFKL